MAVIFGLCMILMAPAFPLEAQGKKVCELKAIKDDGDNPIFVEVTEKQPKKQLRQLAKPTKFYCATLAPRAIPRQICLLEPWGLDVEAEETTITVEKEVDGFTITVE